MSRAVTRVCEAGEAIDRRAGNESRLAHCGAKPGDVESPWVSVKDWRPAFFAYFLCGGKESKCRPAHGQRPRRVGAYADASEKAKTPRSHTAIHLISGPFWHCLRHTLHNLRHDIREISLNPQFICQQCI